MTAQRRTIPQLIEVMKTKPGSVCCSPRIREYAPRTFEDAVRDSDLIIVATLKQGATYLSSDETDLYTDYDVIVESTIAARSGLTAPRATGSTDMMLRQWGGDTTISGVRIHFYDAEFPALPSHQRLLLFLTFNDQARRYEVFDGGVGAFAINDAQRLRHLAEPAKSYERFNGMELPEAVRQIHQLGR